MKVVFKHPPTGTKNPLRHFDPSNPNHYPKKGTYGVYIYGLRLKINGVLKFIPIVVGEGDLFVRLFNDHYNKKFAIPLLNILGRSGKKSKDAKELWDFAKTHYTLPELSRIYADMKKYDSQIGKRGKLSKIVHLNHLIFFQDHNFFLLKHGASTFGKKNIKIEQSIQYLINMLVSRYAANSNNIGNHISKIISTLANFRDNFYYVFACCEDNDDKIDYNDEYIRWSIEKQTKNKLDGIKLYTTADARKGSLVPKHKIDLRKVQNELVNVGGHKYGYPDYNSPLIMI